MVTLFSQVILLVSVCHSQNDAADYHIAGNCSVSGVDLTCSPNLNGAWIVFNGAEAINSQIRINTTDRKMGAAVAPGYVEAQTQWWFPQGRTSTMRLTVYGSADADADLVFMFTEGFAYYLSMSLPLNGEASVYNNAIGPQCDTALVPDSSSDMYVGKGYTSTNAQTGELLAEKAGALAAEMQPPSKVNAWPIVVEIEHHAVEGYFIVRLSSAGSDVVQQCGFARELLYNGYHNFFFGPGDDGQNLRIDSVFLEMWYNEPTTAQPTTMTGAPSEDRTMGSTMAMNPTDNTIESSDDSGDDGLVVGLGAVGRVVVLLVLATVA